MKKFIMAAIAALFCINADAGTISWQLNPTQKEIEYFQEMQDMNVVNQNKENKMLFIMVDLSYDKDGNMLGNFAKLDWLWWGAPEPSFPPSILDPDCIMGTWEVDIYDMKDTDVYETGKIADGTYNVAIIAVWLDSENIFFGANVGPMTGFNGKDYDFYECDVSYSIAAATGPTPILAHFSRDPGTCTLDMIPTNVPEPATGLLALAGIALLARRKRK